MVGQRHDMGGSVALERDAHRLLQAGQVQRLVSEPRSVRGHRPGAGRWIEGRSQRRQRRGADEGDIEHRAGGEQRRDQVDDSKDRVAVHLDPSARQRAGPYCSSLAASSLPRFAISATTVGSASVVVSPSGRFSEMSRKRRRMILPERVFGSSGVKTMLDGAANLPITFPTWSRSSLIIAGDPSWPDFRVTKATIAWPVCASFRPATAASATALWLTRALSISMVEMRWPETFITSSTRPSSQKSPSSSRRAPSPTKYVSFPP